MARIKVNIPLKATETQEQIAFMDWVRLQPGLKPFVIHIANERRCSYARGNMLRKMGVTAGVSDIFIMIPSGGFHGLWIEMKVKPNKPTASQLEFLDNATSQGYATAVCYSSEEAMTAVKDYLSLE